MSTKTASKEEKKVSLMKLSEAVIEYESTRYKNEHEIIQSLFNLVKIARNAEKSTYIIDRPKLYGKVDKTMQNKILIMENDEALGLLIETSCTINGYHTKICKNYDGFIKTIREYEPDLIILDWGNDSENEGILALEKAKKHYDSINKKMPKIIFSTSILDKKTILSHGADFYLPKPYDIQTLIKTINDFLN